LADKDEILVIFDYLLVDYVYLKYKLHSEEFKALFTHYDLMNDTVARKHIDNIVERIYQIHVKIES
jgi:hypothetical protein